MTAPHVRIQLSLAVLKSFLVIDHTLVAEFSYTGFTESAAISRGGGPPRPSIYLLEFTASHSRMCVDTAQKGEAAFKNVIASIPGILASISVLRQTAPTSTSRPLVKPMSWKESSLQWPQAGLRCRTSTRSKIDWCTVECFNRVIGSYHGQPTLVPLSHPCSPVTCK